MKKMHEMLDLSAMKIDTDIVNLSDVCDMSSVAGLVCDATDAIESDQKVDEAARDGDQKTDVPRPAKRCISKRGSNASKRKQAGTGKKPRKRSGTAKRSHARQPSSRMETLLEELTRYSAIWGTSANMLRMEAEMAHWLFKQKFTHFITLAMNDANSTYECMRHRLKAFDAHVNRALLGPKWHSKRALRIAWIAFPEKMIGNPHWHILAKRGPAAGSIGQARRFLSLSSLVEDVWRGICPGGTTSCSLVQDPRVISYCMKDIGKQGYFERFVLSGEFVTTR